MAEFFALAVEGGVLTVTINRPKKKNSLNGAMYVALGKILTDAATNAAVKVVVLTGAGDFYSSGNDLTQFMTGDADPVAVNAAVKALVVAFITFPKPLVAAVNGPAIGIAATTLALCDFVYAADAAYLHTPFVALGQSPEGTSSFSWPRTVGLQRANELLLLGRRIPAREAAAWGLINSVEPDGPSCLAKAKQVAGQLAALDAATMAVGKRVIRRGLGGVDRLKEVNDAEFEELARRLADPAVVEIVTRYMTSRPRM